VRRLGTVACTGFVRIPLGAPANLCGALLSEGNLSGANVVGADLSGADLSGADLSRVNRLTQAQIDSSTTSSDIKLPPGFKAIPRKSPGSWRSQRRHFPPPKARLGWSTAKARQPAW
jgi:pentapeptide repeat protein